jgi:serpin B
MELIAPLAILVCIPWIAAAPAEPPVADTPHAAEAAFGLDLYHRLSDAEGNLCIAPPCLAATLEIALEGARGRTRSQIAEALRIDPARPRDTAPGYSNLEGQRLAMASAVWAQVGFQVRGDYLSAIRQGHAAGFERLDFAAHVEGARGTINRWTADRTGGAVEELLAPGVLDTDTVLVLTSAVHFAGHWSVPFDADRTAEAGFRTPGGPAIDVPFMTRTDRFSYASLDRLDLLELPYAGGRLGLVLLLPHDDEGLRDVEQRLTTENLSAWLDELTATPVRLRLPRFALEARFDLVDALRAMGVTDAFDDQADFSGIGPSRGLFVSDLVHGVRIEVDERGTVGAAASGLAIKKGSHPAEFTADHPFLFVIRDRSDGRVWFVGRVVRPAA